MFRIENNKIYLTKGDNAELSIKVYDRDGKEYRVSEEDTLTLTVKKTATSAVCIQKAAVDGVFSFTPSDTGSLALGLYLYDIQLLTRTGKVYTVVPASIFEIGVEITGGNE